MFLVVTILLLVELTVSMTSVGLGPEERQVIDVPRFDPDCKRPKVCSMLYFFDSDGNPLGEVLGTNKALRVRNVVKVGLSGTGGSYTVFKKRIHRL